MTKTITQIMYSN